MKPIAHRGNLNGPNPEKENAPDYILQALDRYDVEIDVWYLSGPTDTLSWGWYLGHDRPTYKVPFGFLEMPGLWLHLKNLPAMRQLVGQRSNLNYFWHENDQCSRTAQGYLWTCDYTNWDDGVISRAVLMKADAYHEDLMDLGKARWFGALCSDYVDVSRPRTRRFTSSPGPR